MTHRNTTKALLRSPELTLLLALTDALIRTSCRRDAVAVTLHPPRWMRRYVVTETRGETAKTFPVTPRFRSIAKHLVAVAKRSFAAESWSRKKAAHDAEQYRLLRKKQHASASELLAIEAFVEVLGYARASRQQKPQAPRPTPRRSTMPMSSGAFANHNDCY